MQTLSDLILEAQENISDTSDETKAKIIRRMNSIQRRICASSDYFWLEDTYLFDSEASVQTYRLPINCRKVKEVKILSSGITYPVIEIVNQATFDKLNYNGTSTTSDFPTYFNILGNEIRFFPAISTAGLDITITYLKKIKDMLIEDYNTGTVAVTNGSTTVTGTGTTWSTSIVKAGVYCIIDGTPYLVASRTSNTVLLLAQKYQGATASGLDYKIGDAPVIPEEFSDILWLMIAESYYSGKENIPIRKDYKDQRLEVESRLKETSANRTTSTVINRRRKFDVININKYPTLT